MSDKFTFFVYPVCQICHGETPTHTKRGKKIDHARRLKTKTCGSPECHGEMITRSREANRDALPTGPKPKMKRKPAKTKLAVAYDRFTLGYKNI